MGRRIATSTVHHCPLKGKNRGNCNRDDKLRYCKAHEEICRKHTNVITIKGQKCYSCRAIDEANERAEYAKREAARREEQRRADERRQEERERAANEKKPRRGAGFALGLLAKDLYRRVNADDAIIPSPLQTLLPHLSPTEKAGLPYPPDALPGARDVLSPYGSLRVYEWGPEEGRRVLMVHGISTPSIALGTDRTSHTMDVNLLIFHSWSRPWSCALWLSSPAVCKFLYSSNVLPDWAVERLVYRKLSNGSTTDRTLPDKSVEEELPLAERGGDQAASQSKFEIPMALEWQLQHHQGFVKSNISSIRHTPISGQHNRWIEMIEAFGGQDIKGDQRATTCGAARVLIMCEEDDPVIIAKELEEDSKSLVGGTNHLFVVMPGAGHDFPITHSREVVNTITNFWEHQSHQI
ncbi:MAG: hypothetical protein Q9168_007187 [Polycauliona sp. 1 TL-2023]